MSWPSDVIAIIRGRKPANACQQLCAKPELVALWRTLIGWKMHHLGANSSVKYSRVNKSGHFCVIFLVSCFCAGMKVTLTFLLLHVGNHPSEHRLATQKSKNVQSVIADNRHNGY